MNLKNTLKSQKKLVTKIDAASVLKEKAPGLILKQKDINRVNDERRVEANSALTAFNMCTTLPHSKQPSCSVVEMTPKFKNENASKQSTQEKDKPFDQVKQKKSGSITSSSNVIYQTQDPTAAKHHKAIIALQNPLIRKLKENQSK